MKKIKPAPLAREGDHYLISCPGYWGKAATIEQAQRNLPYGLDDDSWILYSVHPETVIDGDGYFRHPKDHRAVEIAACAALRERRTKRK